MLLSVFLFAVYSLMLRCRPKAFPQKAFLTLLIGIGVLGLIPPLLWQAADTGLSPLDFLRPERFSLKPLSGLTVLEVKYDAFLPDLVRMAVQIPNRRAAACSKYALCRRYD